MCSSDLPYLLHAASATTPIQSGPNNISGGTILVHETKMLYISADLSVRIAELAGSNYLVSGQGYCGNGLPGTGDPSAGWYRVIPSISGVNPYARSTGTTQSLNNY